jgi:hypothetical protein
MMPKPSHAAHVRQVLHGTVRLRPRVVVSAVLLECYPRRACFAVFPLQKLLASILVPVKQITSGCSVTQTVLRGWDRCLNVPVNIRYSAWFFPPVLISARAAWHYVRDKLQVFDRAYLIDGALRLEAASRLGAVTHIPGLILFDLTEEDEVAVRSELLQLQGPTQIKSTIETVERIDTATPRLEIKEQWIRIKMESDPFVVPTARGYAPAILVRRPQAIQREHLLIGALSLATALEAIRRKYGSLKGRQVAIRKCTSEKTAPYLVRESD